ncbi:hypothetical protein ABWK57_07580 [Streptomyces sp. NPDC094045]|uniref:hypothetical protein n=1 Tax=Streptomyces sp. NPDC094045 TaxID=3161019 RepID=UPI003393F3D4
METSDSGQDSRREQHNHGSGTFIGGDNHGGIHFEMLDANTKALLVKMTKQSPSLARLLTRALEDGVISPDIVDSLARAARSINEDVAQQLEYAARNINEDVAGLLGYAARSINDDVAQSLASAGEKINPVVAQQLSEAAYSLSKLDSRFDPTELQNVAARFEGVKDSLKDVVTQLDRLQNDNRLVHATGVLDNATERMERLVTPPPPEIIIDRKAQFHSFLWGIGAGAIAALYLFNR